MTSLDPNGWIILKNYLFRMLIYCLQVFSPVLPFVKISIELHENATLLIILVFFSATNIPLPFLDTFLLIFRN